MNLYVEDFSEYDFSEDEFIILNKERLTKHKDLLAARIILEEKGALSLKESDYLLPENIVRIGKYLVAVSEVDKAIDLCITFKFAIQEVVTFLVFMYFNNPESCNIFLKQRKLTFFQLFPNKSSMIVSEEL